MSHHILLPILLISFFAPCRSVYNGSLTFNTWITGTTPVGAGLKDTYYFPITGYDQLFVELRAPDRGDSAVRVAIKDKGIFMLAEGPTVTAGTILCSEGFNDPFNQTEQAIEVYSYGGVASNYQMLVNVSRVYLQNSSDIVYKTCTPHASLSDYYLELIYVNVPQGIDTLRIFISFDQFDSFTQAKLFVIKDTCPGYTDYTWQSQYYSPTPNIRRFVWTLDSASSPPLTPGFYYIGLDNFATQQYSCRIGACMQPNCNINLYPSVSTVGQVTTGSRVTSSSSQQSTTTRGTSSQQATSTSSTSSSTSDTSGTTGIGVISSEQQNILTNNCKSLFGSFVFFNSLTSIAMLYVFVYFIVLY